MNKYELVCVLSTINGEEAVAESIAKVKALVESQATIDSVDEWGRRKLAYEIRDQKEGFYVVMNFTAASTVPHEVERILKISEDVLRYLVVRKDA